VSAGEAVGVANAAVWRPTGEGGGVVSAGEAISVASVGVAGGVGGGTGERRCERGRRRVASSCVGERRCELGDGCVCGVSVWRV
jgi:hypothetical protein